MDKNLSKTDEDFIKSYNEDRTKNNINKEYIFEVDIENPRGQLDLHSDLAILTERMKINRFSKLVCNLYSKKNHVIHIRSLKQALNYGLILKKIHGVIQLIKKHGLNHILI